MRWLCKDEVNIHENLFSTLIEALLFYMYKIMFSVQMSFIYTDAHIIISVDTRFYQLHNQLINMPTPWDSQTYQEIF